MTFSQELEVKPPNQFLMYSKCENNVSVDDEKTFHKDKDMVAGTVISNRRDCPCNVHTLLYPFLCTDGYSVRESVGRGKRSVMGSPLWYGEDLPVWWFDYPRCGRLQESKELV